MGRDVAYGVGKATGEGFQSTLPAWGETLRKRAGFTGFINFNPLSPHGERPGALGATKKTHNYFNPLSPHGESPSNASSAPLRQSFQSTLPAWGETVVMVALLTLHPISILSPRMGRDHLTVGFHGHHTTFQSTLPAWGETRRNYPIRRVKISIHSPRMGRDGRQGPRTGRSRNFNPLSPHGERLAALNKGEHGLLFQSTLPAWGETASTGKKAEDRKISIHSPRMGRDAVVRGQHSTCTLFQSTLPAWGETPRPCQRCVLGAISIHSPRMGRDFHGGFDRVRRIGHFNPLSPHGERPPPTTNHQPPTIREISIHSPRMGRDCFIYQPTNQPNISIHSPRMGRDFVHVVQASLFLYFNPLSPHGERLNCSGFRSRLP